MARTDTHTYIQVIAKHRLPLHIGQANYTRFFTCIANRCACVCACVRVRVRVRDPLPPLA